MTSHAHTISRTSLYVAAARAIGAREPDASARNPDYLAEKLVGDPSRLDIDHPAVRALGLPYEDAIRDVEVVSIVRMMIVRTRFVEEAMRRAIDAGATQVAILGAGFASYAYRCEEALRGVKVFEVDRAVTQAVKMERVREVVGAPPSNLTYVATDFEHDDLREVLMRHGYDPTQRTFFILEGVLMYVPEQAVRSTFRFIGSHPPGSSVVFDFVYRAMIDMIARIDMTKVPESARPYLQRFLDLTKYEPWIFGVPVDGEREFLAEFGLELREAFVLGGEESLKRYVTRADGTQVGAEAMAELMARMQRAQASQPPSATPRMSPEQMREQQRLMAYQLAEAVVS
jgi:methyltransferase (TIGR00027 family)